jgi:hypothetical protein
MADKVASTLNSQVSSVLNGTETVKKAFSNMAKGIIEDVVKYAIKWAVEHAFAAAAVAFAAGEIDRAELVRRISR